MKNNRKIAITMGEPGGVGPEVIAKALHSAEIRGRCRTVVIGNAAVMEEAVKLTGLPLKIRSISSNSDAKPEAGRIEVISVKSRLPQKKCLPSLSAGRAVVKYIKTAVEMALNNEVDAIVTGPISKESLKMAGCSWPGHTELLAELTDTKDFAMMF